MWLWQLPAELTLKLLPLLSLKDIEQCRLACRQWRWHLDNMVKEPISWLAADPVLHDVVLRPHNALPLEREEALYAMHPIINVANDFFVFERKANERFASAVHVVHKCDYEGSVRLTKQTIWLVPFDVLSVDRAFAVYSTPGSNHLLEEVRQACFSTVEIFERRTLRPLPWHAALTNVVAMCQKDNVIYHLCLFNEGDSSSGGQCFKLFALRHLIWKGVASFGVSTFTLQEHYSSRCALNLITCKPHMQYAWSKEKSKKSTARPTKLMRASGDLFNCYIAIQLLAENPLVMWTCGVHSNRLFLANVDCGTVTTMELNGGSYKQDARITFNCPTVLFGDTVIGIRVRSRTTWQYMEYVRVDLINVSTDQLLAKCPESTNLQQICFDRFLVYILEVNRGNEFLLVCIEKNGLTIRKASFPYYPHGLHSGITMAISECQTQLFIHIISNEVRTSLRCSNHVFMFDLAKEDLNSGMRVFNLGLSHYPPAISFTSGLIMQDVDFIKMDADAQWFRAIKMSSFNSSGSAQLKQKRKGTRDCGSLSEPVYLSNCKEEDLSIYMNRHFCASCGGFLSCHTSGGRDISLAVESSVILFDNQMLHPERQIRLIQNRGRCHGFLPKHVSKHVHWQVYYGCEGDATNCFHARWKS